MDAQSSKYHVGIDPGWKNLGLAIIEEKRTGELVRIHTEVMDPSSFSSISVFVNKLDTVVIPLILHADSVTIERFVAYAGVSTAETENICMLIGALSYYFASSQFWDKEPLLVRAIDWKTNLVKTLVKKKQFDNPSSKLDKKFSIAAAHACMDETVVLNTDHEADAICLAAYQSIVRKDT